MLALMLVAALTGAACATGVPAGGRACSLLT